MKRFLFLGIAGLLAASGLAYGAWENLSDDFPVINTRVSEAVYISSYNAGANTQTPGADMIISSYPAHLHAVIISSGGQGSQLEIFNASRSTSAGNARAIANINSSSPQQFIFDVYADSGIMVNNGGTPPAKFSIIWRER